MTLALAIWNGRISPVFDVARQVLLATVEEGRVTSRREAPLPGEAGRAQTARLSALGVEVLVCGARSEPMAAALDAAGIRVVPFTAGPVDDVLAAWLAGTLPCPALTMPGCGGGRRRHGQGSGPGRRRGCGCGCRGGRGRSGRDGAWSAVQERA